MANGEVVFDAPWQGRVFGIAVSLCEGGHLQWTAIQAALIETIGRWEERHGGDDGTYPYFELFEDALNHVLTEHGLVAGSDVDIEVARLRALPHGHDH